MVTKIPEGKKVLFVLEKDKKGKISFSSVRCSVSSLYFSLLESCLCVCLFLCKRWLLRSFNRAHDAEEKSLIRLSFTSHSFFDSSTCSAPLSLSSPWPSKTPTCRSATLNTIVKRHTSGANPSGVTSNHQAQWCSCSD